MYEYAEIEDEYEMTQTDLIELHEFKEKKIYSSKIFTVKEARLEYINR